MGLLDRFKRGKSEYQDLLERFDRGKTLPEEDEKLNTFIREKIIRGETLSEKESEIKMKLGEKAFRRMMEETRESGKRVEAQGAQIDAAYGELYQQLENAPGNRRAQTESSKGLEKIERLAEQQKNEQFIREHGCSKKSYERLNECLETLKKFNLQNIIELIESIMKQGEKEYRDTLQKVEGNISSIISEDPLLVKECEKLQNMTFKINSDQYSKGMRLLYDVLIQKRMADQTLNYAISVIKNPIRTGEQNRGSMVAEPEKNDNQGSTSGQASRKEAFRAGIRVELKQDGSEEAQESEQLSEAMDKYFQIYDDLLQHLYKGDGSLVGDERSQRIQMEYDKLDLINKEIVFSAYLRECVIHDRLFPKNFTGNIGKMFAIFKMGNSAERRALLTGSLILEQLIGIVDLDDPDIHQEIRDLQSRKELKKICEDKEQGKEYAKLMIDQCNDFFASQEAR